VKAVILAGGLGTRISEETSTRPKPMIDIGGRPVLWHILKTYLSHGIDEFIVCAGHKGYVIKEYFANYFLHMSDVTFDLAKNQMEVHENKAEPWRVTVVDTGAETSTGGRLKRVAHYLRDEEAFCMTYGDGLTDLNITDQLQYHRKHGRLATVMAVQPPGRFGSLDLRGADVKGFLEKPKGDGGWINAGYFILSHKVLSLIDDESIAWEEAPMRRLAADGQLSAYAHTGFWQPMDTLRDKRQLEELWETGRAPWKTW
jgi:glucose-1-phosphate cytidylyltransferase